MNKLLVLFIIMFTSKLSAYGIFGKIVNAADTSMGLSQVAIYIDSSNVVYSNTEAGGLFFLNTLSPGTHVLRLQYQNYNDTTFTVVVDTAHYNEYVFAYSIVCKYEQSGIKHDCLVCQKQDEVIPISYGFPSEKGIERANKGEIYLGGCEVSNCDPHWYCKRCKIEF